MLKCACATPAPGEASPSVFPWVFWFAKWLKLLVSGEKIMEGMFFNAKESFQFIWLLHKWIFKKYIPSMERRAWKPCLENEAVNSFFNWKQTAENRKKKSRVSIGRPIYSKIYLYWKKCARAQKSVFSRVISSRFFCCLFCYYDGVTGSEKLVGKEGKKLGFFFSPWGVYIPRNLKEDYTFFFRLYQGIYLRKSEENISKYVPQ